MLLDVDSFIALETASLNDLLYSDEIILDMNFINIKKYDIYKEKAFFVIQELNNNSYIGLIQDDKQVLNISACKKYLNNRNF